MEFMRKKLYLPALFIMAVVLALLVLIGFSTYHNLNRQQQIALQLLQRQGLSLIQGFEAAMRMGWSMGWLNADTLDFLVDEAAANPDISYIDILDDSGAVVIHREDSRETGNAESEARPRPESHSEAIPPFQSRVVTRADGPEIYELTKRFDPRTFMQIDRPAPAGVDPEPSRRLEADLAGGAIVLGMRMERITAAHEADLDHALVMTVIVIALGSSVLFFTYVIQKYYMVNRSLKETQDYTRQVVASLATGLISIDSTGRIQSCNKKALDLLGVSAETETMQGAPLSRILDFNATGIGETLAGGGPMLEKEIGYSLPHGPLRPLSLNVSPLGGQGTASRGAVILLRDLSEIKALEAKVRRAEKLAAVGTLAAGVAHEIRNPLSSIKGFAQYLHKGCPDGSPEKDYTRIMINEVDRINAVVNNLLTFARPMAINPQPNDVAALVGHAIQLVRADAEERNIVIESRFAIDTQGICLDGNQFTQALLNLLLNAIAAIDRNGTITVAVETDQRAGTFRLWVQDDGPGIDPALHDIIFEPFFTKNDKGTGLGLAIVRNIVENHDGDVSVVSPRPDISRGSRFIIEMPLVRSSVQNTKPAASQEP